MLAAKTLSAGDAYHLLRERFTSSPSEEDELTPVSHTHLPAHETLSYLVCSLLPEKNK